MYELLLENHTITFMLKKNCKFACLFSNANYWIILHNMNIMHYSTVLGEAREFTPFRHLLDHAQRIHTTALNQVGY